MRNGGWTSRGAAAAVAALALAALALAAPGAAPAQEGDDAQAVQLPRGTRDALLPGSGLAAITAARALPAAITAVNRLAACGYLRQVDGDAAAVAAGRSFVTLAFTDPTNPAHAPLVVVATDAATSPPTTWAGGGVFALDPATGYWILAPDVGDAGAFVTAGPGLDAGSRAIVPAWVSGPRLRRWAECSLIGCGAALAGCTRIGGMIGLPPQSQAGCAIAGCGLAAFGCLW